MVYLIRNLVFNRHILRPQLLLQRQLQRFRWRHAPRVAQLQLAFNALRLDAQRDRQAVGVEVRLQNGRQPERCATSTRS